MNRRTPLTAAKTIIVKLGSTLVSANGAGLDVNRQAIDHWCQQISTLMTSGKNIILVSSGAIACGMAALSWTSRPTAMRKLQAAAAIGQMRLTQRYAEVCGQYGLQTAQLLLTHDDLRDRKRYLNARNTIIALLELHVMPIVNENDTVITSEIRFGDNDTLSALVANLVGADLMILLTDQAGLFDKDPRQFPNARLIDHGQAGDEKFNAMAAGSGSIFGSGGMASKVSAAKRAARSGCHTVIADGRLEHVLTQICQGESIGTWLHAQTAPVSARKQWLANHIQVAGRLDIDNGAVAALRKGRSLLPVGVLGVIGEFDRGSAVSICTAAGLEIARGLANYPAREIKRLQRHKSSEIMTLLGYFDDAEIIHRDNLVLLD